MLCQRSTSTSQRGRGAARRYLWRTSAASSGAPHPRIEAAAQRRIDSGWLRFSGDRLRTDTVGSKMRCYDLPKYCAASSSPHHGSLVAHSASALSGAVGSRSSLSPLHGPPARPAGKGAGRAGGAAAESIRHQAPGTGRIQTRGNVEVSRRKSQVSKKCHRKRRRLASP